MKAAARVRAYLDAIKKGRDADSPYYNMNGTSLYEQDLEALLASRARYRRRARAEHKAAENLLAELVQAKSAAVDSARQQRTEQIDVLFRAYYPGAASGIATTEQKVEQLQKVLSRAREADAQVQTYKPAAAMAETKLHDLLRNTVDVSCTDSPDAVTALQNGLNRSRSIDQRIILDRGQAWQLLRRATRKPEFPSTGVQKISEARAYQMKHHPSIQTNTSEREARREELFAAAMALMLDNKTVYPFGEQSFLGIKKYYGRKNQLAHAGACIAALIDLLLPSGVAPLDKDGEVPF